MLRRLLRARRRVPVQSAGHDSADRGHDDKPCPDVYHACIKGDGPMPLFPEDVASARTKKKVRTAADLFRERARSYISHVSQEERNAAQAWLRLQQLYSVFQTLQEAAHEGDAPVDDADSLAQLLLAQRDVDESVLYDFEELTANLPEGFTSQMFAELGNVLYSEMMASQQQQDISRESFENVGRQLYDQSVVSVAVYA